ncbi:hypothetical protein BCV69DRAFT_200605 [Microstroma glucosiphilum]|uniref:Uncharacterized protein n=1 Tax=Pseudomicrostroma glucosiphilum TaxID=1684307 RepID=A0A316U6J0_9BASI|nr:hypothetical protein BCV69DRAFT_200605 [Pseudomicrostroma glucosiphilum]PWN20830.1 hypothetical protein BCV69DRAFT_200605 [Pseudomicrostroma glucosiphilum]
MRSTLKLVAIARHEVGMLTYLILHSSHSYKVVIELKGLSDVAAEPNIEAQHMSSVIVQNFGRLVGTLRVAEVGARLVPAMATFHAGVIKYNGDTILRADRHLLLRLIALKIRLLDYFAVEGKTAAEVIEATQQAAESIGLEPALLAARDRVERRESALNTLQSLSTLLRHAHAQDEIFRAGEEAWQKEVVHEYNGTRSRRLVTVEDRESQLRLLFEARGGQLQDLPLPNGIKATDPGAKEAWCLWFRGLKTNVSAERAAAGSRASKGEAYVAARAQRETNPGLLQRVKATAQGGTFRHTLSVDAARAALEKKVFGARKGVHDYHCKVCGSSALIDLNTSQFAHTCGRKEVLIKKHDDERFIMKRMQSSADIEVAAEQSAL